MQSFCGGFREIEFFNTHRRLRNLRIGRPGVLSLLISLPNLSAPEGLVGTMPLAV